MDRKTVRSHLNFEALGKLFFDISEERYPSAEKMKQLAGNLVNPIAANATDRAHAKIAILNMMRDMVKEVSPGQLYRSLQHRDDVYTAILEALEELEDELDELYEESQSETGD